MSQYFTVPVICFRVMMRSSARYHAAPAGAAHTRLVRWEVGASADESITIVAHAAATPRTTRANCGPARQEWSPVDGGKLLPRRS